MIYISHHLDEVFAIADRVTVLRDGRVVGTYATTDLDEDRLVSLMCGDVELSPRIERDTSLASKPVLEVRSLCGTVVDDVSFTAYSGEVLGIAGLTGSGREQILRLLFGALPRSGEVLVDGKLAPPHPTKAVAAGIALVPADRTGGGSIVDLTVRENFTLADLKRHSRAGARQQNRGTGRNARMDQGARHPLPRPEAVFDSLSGGNQQKVALAKRLRMKPRVVLLDEPTQGVDVQAKATIHALARKAAADGATVVIASSDDAEICDTCDRALIMRDGRFVGQIERDDLSPETISSAPTRAAAPLRRAPWLADHRRPVHLAERRRRS